MFVCICLGVYVCDVCVYMYVSQYVYEYACVCVRVGNRPASLTYMGGLPTAEASLSARPARKAIEHG